MDDALLNFCKWLAATSLGVMVRESIWGFPIIVAIHILGLMFSVGFLLWFDLRLLGIGFTGARVSAIYRRLMSFAAFGFLSMFVTGGMLFTGFATEAYGNVYFRTKMAALALAAANALFYHLVTERGILTWDANTRPPAAARFAGLASLILWTTVILCGRMMSYTMF